MPPEYRDICPEPGSKSWLRRIEPLGNPILDDLRNHVALCLKAVLGAKPTPLQYDVSQYLQYGPQMRIIFGFRGMSKSYLTSFFDTWLIARNYELTGGKVDLNTICVSGTKDRAENFTSFTRELLYHVKHLKHLIPAEPKRWSLTNFDVESALPSQNPTVASRAVFGRMAGDRGDVIIGDDLELPQNAETEGQREKLGKRVADFQNILKPGGECVLLGTPHFEDTIYHRLKENGYSRRIWTGRVPAPEKVDSYDGDLAPYVLTKGDPGAPVEPTRFDEVELQRAEMAGRSVFAMQWMLDTSLSDADRYPLKLRDLILTDLSPQAAPSKLIWSGSPDNRDDSLACYGLRGDSWQKPMGSLAEAEGGPTLLPYTGVVLAIDPSGKGADETAWATVATMGNYMFLIGTGRDKRGYEDPVLEQILRELQRTNCKHVIYEENYGGGMFGSILQGFLTRNNYPCTVEPVRHTNMKEGRIIDALEPVMNQHRLVVDRSVAMDDPPAEGEGGHRYRLWHQMTRIERVRGALSHDDRLEAVAMAVQHWTELQRVDHDLLLQSHENEQRAEAVRGFWDRVAKRRGPVNRSHALTNAGFNYGDPHAYQRLS